MRTFVGVDCYLTIDGPAEGTSKDRGSRFLGYAFPVEDLERVKEHVDRLRNEHHAARHHCYAYRIGNQTRSNDDGEPSGSAGRPILGQIDARGLNNVLVVVVRYFGGTLLGVPGLIAAYKSAAAEALDAAQVVERVVKATVEVETDYAELDKVLRVVRAIGAETTQMDDNEGRGVRLKIEVRLSQTEALKKRIEELRLEQTNII